MTALLHALAAVALAAVAQFDRLERTGRGAAGHRGARERAVVERDLDLDGGVAARVEDLAGADGLDACHTGTLTGGAERSPAPTRDVVSCARRVVTLR